jgi:hypothetical protein
VNEHHGGFSLARRSGRRAGRQAQDPTIDKERLGPLVAALSTLRVCEIDARMIKNYQQARRKQVGNRTINLECKLLRHVLKAAKVWSHIADDYKALREDRCGPGRARSLAGTIILRYREGKSFMGMLHSTLRLRLRIRPIADMN